METNDTKNSAGGKPPVQGSFGPKDGPFAGLSWFEVLKLKSKIKAFKR